MLEEIIKRYDTFGDALIFKVDYLGMIGFEGVGHLEATIFCRNHKEDGAYEIIKLKFWEVIRFRFTSNAPVFCALLTRTEEGILVDFFPILQDLSVEPPILYENKDSLFSVLCKEITYEVLEKCVPGIKSHILSFLTRGSKS